MGVLSFMPYDFLRKRHFKHHEIDYNPKITPKLVAESYVEACDVSFNWLALIVIGMMSLLSYNGVISWLATGSYLAGAIGFAVFFIAPFHAFYHLNDHGLRNIWKANLFWDQFKWLQSYHEAHHYYNCNYAIVIPVDMVLGTYMPPKKFRERKKQGKIKRENIFPGFRGTPNGCFQPLFTD